MKKLIYIIFFLTLNSTGQSLGIKEIQFFEIMSRSEIDSTRIIVNSERAVKSHKGKDILINEKDKESLKKFIINLFVTKKYNVFKCREKVEGFSYSANQILTINVTFNENEKDMYYVDLSKSNYKVEYSDEFKAFLKLFYNIR